MNTPFNECEADFAQQPQYMADPHPCAADYNEVKNDDAHFVRLSGVQRHKCVGTYCLRRKKDENGREYGETYCRFGFPLKLVGKSRLEFVEMDNGSVQAKKFTTRND